MLLLAIDSAEAVYSAALWDAARPKPQALLGHRRLLQGRGQADLLVELIDDLLSAARLGYRSLDAVAVNHGPGSFTGLRSAVAAARGLALAAGLPVVAVTSLEALAAAVPERGSGTVVAALNAGRGQVYAQAFNDRQEPQTAPCALTPHQVTCGLDADAGPLRVVGSGAVLIRAALPADRHVVIETAELDACWVAQRAASRLADGAKPQSGGELRPLYLRPPDARPQPARLASARAQAVEA